MARFREIAEPTPQKSWHNDPVTEKQRILLTLYGIDALPEMTKGQASDLINQNKAKGGEPKPENVRRHKRLTQEYEEKEHERGIESNKVEICGFIDRLKPKELSLDDLCKIRDEFRGSRITGAIEAHGPAAQEVSPL